MNILMLVWNYFKSKPLNSALNVLLMALGVAVITILLMMNQQLEDKIKENVKGIDLVVGAKGSPMQLILCNIFHVDFPTGNIKILEAEKIARNRLVKKAIPLALGDSYRGYRIIGTNAEYPSIYEAKLTEGEWWKKELEVVIGDNVASVLKLKLGDRFVSAHGLTNDGHGHDEHQFVVKGILKKNSSIIDNLILTSIETVWLVHEGHNDTARDTIETIPNPSRLVPSISANDSVKEVTSLLIEYKSPMGVMQLPRIVNMQSGLQAASPAFETARLFTILGIGVEVLTGFAYVLIFISALSIFIALYNALKERRYDLAIMRTMGATRRTLVTTVLLEGALLTFLGTLLGLLFGHAMLVVLTNYSPEAERTGFTGLVFYKFELFILAAGLLIGMFCAIIPAIQAYRTDISKVLAGN